MGRHLGPQIDAKINENMYQKTHWFLEGSFHEKWSQNGRPGEPKTLPKHFKKTTRISNPFCKESADFSGSHQRGEGLTPHVRMGPPRGPETSGSDAPVVSSWRPRALPKAFQKSINFSIDFLIDFGSILVPKCFPKPPKIHHKSFKNAVKSMPKFDLRFWTTFYGFDVVWGRHLEAKMKQKCIKKTTENLIDFWMAFGRALGCQMEATRASGCPSWVHGDR